MNQKYAAPAASRLTLDFWPTVKVYLGLSWLMSHIGRIMELSQHWRWHPRGADKCHPLWSSFLCPRSVSTPGVQTPMRALLCAPEHATLGLVTRRAQWPTHLCAPVYRVIVMIVSIDYLLCIVVSHISNVHWRWPSPICVTCIFHFRVSWPHQRVYAWFKEFQSTFENV